MFAWPSSSWTVRRSAPPLQEVGRERVAQGVRADRLRDQAGSGVAPEHLPDPLAGEAAPAPVDEECSHIGSARDEARALLLQVPGERLRGRTAERDDALLVPLADASHEAGVEVEASHVERETSSETRSPVP